MSAQSHFESFEAAATAQDSEAGATLSGQPRRGPARSAQPVGGAAPPATFPRKLLLSILLRSGAEAGLRLARYFSAIEPTWSCVSTADLESALATLPSNTSAAALVELPTASRTECNAPELLVQLCRRASVLCIVKPDDFESAVSAMKVGARGCLIHPAGPPLIAAAIRQLVSDHAALSARAQNLLLYHLRCSASLDAIPEHLTGRERQIADLLLKRKRNKDIADTLEISVSTVNELVHRVLHKLHVPDRYALHSRFAPGPEIPTAPPHRPDQVASM